MANLSAEDWLWMPSQEIEDLLTSNSTWPFRNISKDDFLNAQQSLDDNNLANKVKHVWGSVISTFGVIFTILLMCSLWFQVSVKKNTFYMAMMIIAGVDLAFNLLGFVFFMWRSKYSITGSQNYVFMWVLLGVRGLLYTTSLMSDMCAVALTFERYLSISRPHLHFRMFQQHKTVARTGMAIVIFMISMSRMHYSLDRSVEATDGVTYFYVKSVLASNPLVVFMNMLSDTILPFILLVGMILLSCLFNSAVVKREKNRVKKFNHATHASFSIQPLAGGNSSQNRIVPVEIVQYNVNAPVSSKPKSTDAGHDIRSMQVLTLALDLLFLLNQIGYCLYWVSSYFQDNAEFTYESTKEDLQYWITVAHYNNYADIFVSLSECLSHSFNFPLYVALSKSMRQEFLSFCKKIKFKLVPAL